MLPFVRIRFSGGGIAVLNDELERRRDRSDPLGDVVRRGDDDVADAADVELETSDRQNLHQFETLRKFKLKKYINCFKILV